MVLRFNIELTALVRRASCLLATLAISLAAAAPSAAAQNFNVRYDFWELPLETVLQIVVTDDAGDEGNLAVLAFERQTTNRNFSLARELRALHARRALPDLVIINGMRIDADESRKWLSSIRARWVERVEIIHGNAAILWGSEAERGGVLIVTLKENWGHARTRVPERKE